MLQEPVPAARAKSRAPIVAGVACVVAIAALRLPDADSAAFASLTDDHAVRAVLGSIPAAVLLVVLLWLRDRSATAMIAFGLLGMLLQTAATGAAAFVPASLGGSIAFVGYLVVLVAGVVLYARGR